jgi:nucleoside-diphosphate-sugar epimerase
MKVCVIGGTGHVGRFLVPTLVREGYDVTVTTSGHTPVGKEPEWSKVKFQQGRYLRNDKKWYDLIAGIGCDVLIDILGTDVPGVYQATRKTCKHLIACGSVWMFGPPLTVPTPPETQGPCQFEEYTLRYKELHQIKKQAKSDGVAFTAVMPPNICGPGKVPIDALGGRDVQVHQAMKEGKPVYLPEGCNTLVGPCDTADIADIFALAVAKRDKAADEIFNAGAAYALTSPKLMETFGDIYRTRIPCEFVSMDKYINEILPDVGSNYHFLHHMCPDISKTQIKLGYQPKYTPEETLQRAIEWMYEEKLLTPPA